MTLSLSKGFASFADPRTAFHAKVVGTDRGLSLVRCGFKEEVEPREKMLKVKQTFAALYVGA